MNLFCQLPSVQFYRTFSTPVSFSLQFPRILARRHRARVCAGHSHNLLSTLTFLDSFPLGIRINRRGPVASLSVYGGRHTHKHFWNTLLPIPILFIPGSLCTSSSLGLYGVEGEQITGSNRQKESAFFPKMEPQC